MRVFTCTAGAAAVAVGVSILAGCSGGAALGAPTPGLSPQSLMQQAIGAPPTDPDGAYVVTGTASGQYVINEYRLNDGKNGKPLCSIAGGTSYFPGDLATDRHGNLWVPTIATPSTGSVWEVVEYAPGCGQSMLSLQDSATGQPAGVAFNSKGVVYVANEVSASFGPGNVAVFLPGQTSPSTVLTSPLIGSYVLDIAIDANDDVFVTCDTSSFKTEVVEFAKGKGSGAAVNVSGFSVVDGITFDNHQNMILTDYALAQDEVYAPPYSGAPTATVPLLAGSNPAVSRLNKNNSQLFVTDHTGYDVYAYPAGTHQYSVTNGMGKFGAGGLALDPKAPN